MYIFEPKELDDSWQSSDDGMEFWTDDDEDSETGFTDTGLNETSPIGYGADEEAAIHEELKEFLGSDDESESDSEAPPALANNPTSAPSNKKRKREDGTTTDTSEDEDASETDNNPTDEGSSDSISGSRLAQRIKRSYARSTSLKEVATLSNTGSTVATEQSADATDNYEEMTTPRDEQQPEESPGDDSREIHDPPYPEEEDDELEREMLAAFEDGEYDGKAEQEIGEENG